MAAAGAFVFAAQMVNFTIPATGSSGHIVGGILLAALLGAFPAFLAMSAALTVQCLFFADGGLLALGCNIFNMGVIPCLLIYPLVFKPLTHRGTQPVKITAAAVASVVAASQFGALSVAVETQASGITALPFAKFALLMLPVHLATGLVEGAVTAAVLCLVHRTRPEIMVCAAGGRAAISAPVWNVAAAFAVMTLLAGGGLSLLASAHPDGLEWAVARTTGGAELEAGGALAKIAATVQSAAAFMPEYNFKNAGESVTGTSVAGIVGGALTFSLVGIVAFAAAFRGGGRKEFVLTAAPNALD
jgi:cobalt/nickel transport system permease protein